MKPHVGLPGRWHGNAAIARKHWRAQTATRPQQIGRDLSEPNYLVHDRDVPSPMS